MKLHLPLDAKNVEEHEIMMTDVKYLRDLRDLWEMGE
jgi:hypothetical protein